MERIIYERCRYQHVEKVSLLVPEDERITIVQRIIAHRGRSQWIWLCFVEGNAVLTCSQAEVLCPVRHPSCIKAVERSLVKES